MSDELDPGDGDESVEGRFSIICLSSQVWSTPLPTNRQQIMRRAASRGHRVLFVETTGFIGKHTVRLVRGPGRASLLRRLVTGEQVAPGITVRATVNLLPFGYRHEVSDRLNGGIGAFLVRRAALRLPSPRVTWLYDPRATWAVDRTGDAISVYDCVDDYAQQVDSPRARSYLAGADHRAARSARVVFVTTEGLARRHRASNPRTHVVRNVGDYQHFSQAADRSKARPDLLVLPGPVLGFAGNILSGKVDVALLEAIADHDQGRTLLLAGPVDMKLAPLFRRLLQRDNVVWTGPIPYEELPAVVAAFDVGLIPYESNEYTENVFPLKLYEYLAAGKPVVATGLPELRGMEPDVVVTDAAGIEHAIAATVRRSSQADVERRQAIAAVNTWDTRAQRLLELTEEELRRS